MNYGIQYIVHTQIKIGYNIQQRGGENMEAEENRKALLESLVDIRDVKIDSSMPIEDRMKSYVTQIKNPYMFKVGATVVRVSYANTQATINDNFASLLASM